MNTNPSSSILRFPTTRVDRTAATRVKFRQHELLELALPVALSGDATMMLGGENILLPIAGHPSNRYACCAYLVSADGHKALPVISCRPWFHAPLPAQELSHPVWEDLSGGLLEAANRLDESSFDLNGAIDAARSWMGHRHGELAARAGSALLVGRDLHVLCAAAPTCPPPAAAKAPVLTFVPGVVRPLPRQQSLRLSA